MGGIIAYLPLVWHGLLVTVAAWFLAGACSLSIGLCGGVLSCRRLKLSSWQKLIRFYTFVAKGIPAYVQILIAYFVIPSLFNFSISNFWAATLALAFCSSGYMAEIFRAALNMIPAGQWDAGLVLGYSLKDVLRKIILPQALRNVLPALLGELEQLLKSTALLATIGVTELTRSGMNIISRELNPIPVYLLIAFIYLFLAAILQLFSYYIERRFYIEY